MSGPRPPFPMEEKLGKKEATLLTATSVFFATHLHVSKPWLKQCLKCEMVFVGFSQNELAEKKKKIGAPALCSQFRFAAPCVPSTNGLKGTSSSIIVLGRQIYLCPINILTSELWLPLAAAVLNKRWVCRLSQALNVSAPLCLCRTPSWCSYIVGNISRIPDLSFLYLSTGVSVDVLPDSHSVYSQPLMGGNVDAAMEVTVLYSLVFLSGEEV